MRILKWLMHGKGDEEKHKCFWHPFISGILTLLISLVVMYYLCTWAHDYFHISYYTDPFDSIYIGSFLLTYFLFLIFGRRVIMGNKYNIYCHI